MATIDSKIPEGPISEKWTNYKAHQKLVNFIVGPFFRNRTVRYFGIDSSHEWKM